MHIFQINAFIRRCSTEDVRNLKIVLNYWFENCVFRILEKTLKYRMTDRMSFFYPEKHSFLIFLDDEVCSYLFINAETQRFENYCVVLSDV
jgi:hypothetical protein